MAACERKKAKTYGIDSFARWTGPVRVYVSTDPHDRCLRIRQDNCCGQDQEIIVARHAAANLCAAILCAIRADELGIGDGEIGPGDEGFQDTAVLPPESGGNG